MDGRCVDPRDANDPRATDAVDRGEVSQRILAYPSTHAERATEVPEFDDDGLESGRDEAFRGFLEAGGTSRWEDQARGKGIGRPTISGRGRSHIGSAAVFSQARPRSALEALVAARGDFMHGFIPHSFA